MVKRKVRNMELFIISLKLFDLKIVLRLPSNFFDIGYILLLVKKKINLAKYKVRNSVLSPKFLLCVDMVWI